MTKRQSDFLDAFILGMLDLPEHLPESSTELELRAFDLAAEWSLRLGVLKPEAFE